MQIAVLTFEGFNELDSFVAAAILNRMKAQGWAAHITSPTEQVTSMNGVTIQRQKPLEFTAEADAVLIGSGIKTREIAADADLLSRIRLDPSRQLIGAQCSGTLLLAKLGLGWRPARLHRSHHKALGDRGGRKRDRCALHRAWQHRDRGRLPRCAIPRHLDDRARRFDARCGGSDALRRTGG